MKKSYSNEEFTSIYRLHADMVWRLCFTFMKNRHDTEDAFQSAFLKLMNCKNPPRDDEHIKAWLIVTASNTCRDMLKKACKSDISLDDCDTATADDNLHSEVLKAVLDLPLKYRSVVYLYYYEGYKSDEIAVMLDKPASTVRSHLSEARKFLKDILGGDFYEE